jgi:hypothetical protein
MKTNPLISDRFACKCGAIVAKIVAWKHGTNVLLGTMFWGTNIALYYDEAGDKPRGTWEGLEAMVQTPLGN